MDTRKDVAANAVEPRLNRRALAVGVAATGALVFAGQTLAQNAPPAGGGARPAGGGAGRAGGGRPPAPVPSDTTGLVAGKVTFPTYDTTIGAYRAYPTAKPKGAATIVFLPMIKGYNMPAHQDFVRRLAKEGYYVIMPDLYARKGDANAVPFNQVVLDLVANPNDAEEQLDIDAAIAFAASEGADTRKLGMVGYDNGARITWKYTARNAKVLAGVAYSGPITAVPLTIPGKTESHPTPVEIADGVHGRILAIFGENEGNTKPEDISEMRQALAAAGDKKTEIVVMPGGHGFIMSFDTTPASKEAWAMGVAWLKSHGVS